MQARIYFFQFFLNPSLRSCFTLFGLFQISQKWQMSSFDISGSFFPWIRTSDIFPIQRALTWTRIVLPPNWHRHHCKILISVWPLIYQARIHQRNYDKSNLFYHHNPQWGGEKGWLRRFRSSCLLQSLEKLTLRTSSPASSSFSHHFQIRSDNYQIIIRSD